MKREEISLTSRIFCSVSREWERTDVTFKKDEAKRKYVKAPGRG